MAGAKTKSKKSLRQPVDQARKADRAREIKKNKRERAQVRQAIAKHADCDKQVQQALELHRQMLGLEKKTFLDEVLRKKQNVVLAHLNSTKSILEKEKDKEGLEKWERAMRLFHSEKRKIEQMAAQQRLAENVSLDSIPMPMGDFSSDAAGGPARMGGMGGMGMGAGMHMPGAGVSGRRGVSGKSSGGRHGPPGVPQGIPPEFSDSDGEADYDENIDDDNLEPVIMPDFLNGGGGGAYTPIVPLRQAPPPPMPPGGFAPPPFGRPPPMMAAGPQSVVIESAAEMRPHAPAPAPVAPTLSAAPQLRDLRGEATKMVPAQLRRKTAAPVPRKRTVAAPQASTQAKDTDEAYNDFMKELEGLI